MESAFRNTWTRFLLVFTVLALLTGTVWAQGVAELTGVVTDPTGAVVSGATVTLTKERDWRKADNDYDYNRKLSFPFVAGRRHLCGFSSLKGFKSKKIEGIVVSVGITASADLKLEVCATEQVTVEASAETVQTTESSVSELVDRTCGRKCRWKCATRTHLSTWWRARFRPWMTTAITEARR